MFTTFSSGLAGRTGTEVKLEHTHRMGSGSSNRMCPSEYGKLHRTENHSSCQGTLKVYSYLFLRNNQLFG